MTDFSVIIEKMKMDILLPLSIPSWMPYASKVARRFDEEN